MKGNKRKVRVTDANPISNDPDARQSYDDAKVTATPGRASNKSHHDQIDHSQEEQQQVGLLANELPQERGDTRHTLTSRFSAFALPNIGVKSHYQKRFDSDSVPAETDTTTARAMKKMRDDSSGNRRSGVDVAELESNEKRNKRACSKIGFIIIAAMALAIVAILVVFLLHSVKVLDNEPRCYSYEQSYNNYKLWATKTLYTTTLSYISKAPVATSLPLTSTVNPTDQHLNNNHHQYYDKSSVFVPKLYNSPESLETIHRNLTKDQNCTLVQYHFFGRHAARTPDDDEINTIIQHINRIKSRIQKPSAAALNNQPQPPLSADVTDTVKSEAVNTTEAGCFDPVNQLGIWEDFLSSGSGNIITEAGSQETVELAQRLKAIYPEIFDGNLSTINIGITKELRTAQTAISFLKQVTNFNNNVCSLDKFPDANSQIPENVHRIKASSCYKNFLDKYQKDFLRFYKKCKDINSGKPQGPKFNITEPNAKSFIAKAVSERLSLTGDDMLTVQELDTIYDVCRFESAQIGRISLWCHAFTDAHLKFYEYLLDAWYYHNEAYGHPNMAKSACEVTSIIHESFTNYSKARQAGNAPKKPEANFYFTHSSAIQKLIAASIDLEGETAYSEDAIAKSLASGIAPNDRQWQSSLLSPFSANIAFSLYDCNVSPIISGDFVVLPYKIVASLNEQPLKLDGCQDFVCELNAAKRDARLFRGVRDCNYQKICIPNYVVT